jgi:hypothetical protein
MALVTCPDCQAQISDAAPACPRCGRPAQAAFQTGWQAASVPEERVLFHDATVTVTNVRAIVRQKTTYAMSNVTSVRELVEQRPPALVCSSLASRATRASHPVARSSTSAAMALANACSTTSPQAENSASPFVVFRRLFRVVYATIDDARRTRRWVFDPPLLHKFAVVSRSCKDQAFAKPHLPRCPESHGVWGCVTRPVRSGRFST